VRRTATEHHRAVCPRRRCRCLPPLLLPPLLLLLLLLPPPPPPLPPPPPPLPLLLLLRCLMAGLGQQRGRSDTILRLRNFIRRASGVKEDGACCLLSEMFQKFSAGRKFLETERSVCLSRLALLWINLCCYASTNVYLFVCSMCE
jgi:hypothetical protein